MKRLLLAGLAVLFAAAAHADEKGVANCINAFAFDLYGQLRTTQDGNLFVSPYSISTALAMTYAGAAGTTREQMTIALHFPMDADLHAGNRALAKRLNRPNDAFELAVANRVWAQDGLKFLEDFTSLLERNYDAQPVLADFARNAAAVCDEINAWVDEQTRGKIRDLVSPQVINPMTRMVLVNAIYFKGKWLDEFRKDATADEPFTLASGRAKPMPMMHRMGTLRYAEDDAVQVLELPYRGEQLSMIVVLPRGKLAELEPKLTAQAMDGWIAALGAREVDVSLPRFRIESSFSLNDTLSAMGMPSAFGMGADFSGMTGTNDLYISAVLHKAFVDVNEEGTEAAAATAVVMELKAMPMRPVEFRADHPFVFAIRDNESGAILFLGRVVQPAE